ncbi:MAG TPA: hypothetical protein DCE41_08385 [Cytophagales bacterium]|nr:hypothetical protein [Cytophagales bacterium]HAA19290.1 hypothetical protein [Cytophagales bacterium]HAP61190.1 hypothetical protein [Cytophagales bacterium]
MPQFISSDPNAQVKSTTLLELKNFVSEPFRPMLDKILKANGVFVETPEEWYPMQLGLDVCREIQDTVGPHTMFSIGKKAGELRQFPDGIATLAEALKSLNEAYKASHRGGAVGFYELISEDVTARRIEFKAQNPYPDEFDRGILMSVARKFKPTNAINIEVNRKEGVPSRMDDHDFTIFVITWEAF